MAKVTFLACHVVDFGSVLFSCFCGLCTLHHLLFMNNNLKSARGYCAFYVKYLLACLRLVFLAIVVQEEVPLSLLGVLPSYSAPNQFLYKLCHKNTRQHAKQEHLKALYDDDSDDSFLQSQVIAFRCDCMGVIVSVSLWVDAP